MSELNSIRSDADAIPTILVAIKKRLGVKLAKLILNADGTTLNRWIQSTELPNETQRRLIYSTGYVINILSSTLTDKDLRLWLISHSEYLYGIPAVEIRTRPEDVHNAALNRVSRGEYYELLNDQLNRG